MLLTTTIIILSILLDQLSKHLVLTYLAPGSVTVIPGVLDFTYAENRGAAFGMFADQRWIFLTLSTVMIAAVVIYLYVSRPKSVLVRVALALVAGGGVGNMIDRVGRGFVVDFIEATFVDFYIFNIADSCVCVGCGLMILWMILDGVRESREKKAAAANAAGSAGDTAKSPAEGESDDD